MSIVTRRGKVYLKRQSGLRHSISKTCEYIALETTSQQIHSEFVFSRICMLEGVGAVEYD